MSAETQSEQAAKVTKILADLGLFFSVFPSGDGVTIWGLSPFEVPGSEPAVEVSLELRGDWIYVRYLRKVADTLGQTLLTDLLKLNFDIGLAKIFGVFSNGPTLLVVTALLSSPTLDGASLSQAIGAVIAGARALEKLLKKHGIKRD